MLLGANLVYCLPASIVTRPSSSEGVILVKTSESWSYRRGSPLHLGLLSEYLTAEGVKPIFFPTSDFFLKGIFPKNADFPDFIQFLKNVNKKIGSPWFSVVRYGEKDYKLCEREYSSFVSKVAARGSSRDLPLGKRSNYVFIEGLSLFQNRAEISSFFSKDLGIPVISCEWGRSIEFQHRLIVEIDTDIDNLKTENFPPKIRGVGVDYTTCHYCDVWEDVLCPSSLGPLKCLTDPSPNLDGSLKELFAGFTKHFLDIAVKAKKANAIPVGDNQNAPVIGIADKAKMANTIPISENQNEPAKVNIPHVVEEGGPPVGPPVTGCTFPTDVAEAPAKKGLFEFRDGSLWSPQVLPIKRPTWGLLAVTEEVLGVGVGV